MSKHENKTETAAKPQKEAPHNDASHGTDHGHQGGTAHGPHDSHPQKKQAHTPAPTNNVIAMPGKCMADGCAKKSEKANFCMEHFDWFKEGLITKEGRRPTDFEKKYFHYMNRKRAA